MSDKPIAKCRRHLNEKDTLTVFSMGCHLWATPVYKSVCYLGSHYIHLDHARTCQKLPIRGKDLRPEIFVFRMA